MEQSLGNFLVHNANGGETIANEGLHGFVFQLIIEV